MVIAVCVSLGCEKRMSPTADVRVPEAKQSFRRKIEPHPQTEELRSYLTKDQTLSVLAFDSVVRENLFTSDFYGIDPHQVELCLLYTSPSPRDQRGSRMPSSA